MTHLLVLGAGTAGTIVANKLRHALSDSELSITVVDQDDEHHYQPGYLFIPFGDFPPARVAKSRRSFLPKGVDYLQAEVDRVDADAGTVSLVDGRQLSYDYLVIASGSQVRPDQTPGVTDEAVWRSSVFDFYTHEGSVALKGALERFTGGRLVVHITELPIKCPVAPLEFAFLAEAYFTERGIRDQVEIVYVTPLDGAFTKPVASAELGHLLSERNIAVEPEFMVESVDPERKVLMSYDEREVPFDLLVTVPLHMGAEFVQRSGLGDELGFVKVDKHTMRSVKHENVFALGDAGNLPTSKAGSVAHFSVDVFVDNFLAELRGQEPSEQFDGHANCFVESGYGKAMLIDFNYDTQPLPGTFPLSKVGPMALLKQTRANHLGKLAFEWVYWHMLLPGRPLPVPTLMSMSGKREPAGV